MPEMIEVRALGSRDPLSDPLLSRELAERYLVFDAFVAGARRVDLHPLVLSPELHRAAVRAAEGITRAVGRIATRAHHDPTEAARYGLHDDVLRLARASHEAGDHAALCRVDLLLGEDGRWRACEINADCPGGHNEAHGLPRLCRLAGFSDGSNPTTVLDALASRLAALAAHPATMRPTGRPGAVALVYATAYAEDLQVCALIQRALKRLGIPAVLCPPTAPQGRNGVLHVGDLPISVLYRFFPTEYMEGQRNLPAILDALSAGSLRTLSSFAHIFCQSKLALARAWQARTDLPLDEQEILQDHLPETHDVADLSPAELFSDRAGWVLKKALGRVGDEVFVGALCQDQEWALLLSEVLRLRAAGESWIAQRFVRQRPVPTPFGDRLVTLGAYVLDGRFVGYFARLTTDSHVSHDALCVPVFTAVEKSR